MFQNKLFDKTLKCFQEVKLVNEYEKTDKYLARKQEHLEFWLLHTAVTAKESNYNNGIIIKSESGTKLKMGFVENIATIEYYRLE